MNKTSIGVHWFRRDLRVCGNPALQLNYARNEGRVLGLFMFDRKFLSRPDFSHNRFAFFLSSIKELKADLEKIGVELLVIDAPPAEGLNRICQKLKQSYKAVTLSFNRDYEPFARTRDQEARSVLKSINVELIEAVDHLLLEPAEVSKPDGSPYKVYSPFYKQWRSLLQGQEVSARLSRQQKSLTLFEKTELGKELKTPLVSWRSDFNDGFTDALEEFQRENSSRVTVPIPAAGFGKALMKVKEFAKQIDEYGEQRDFPALSGTSKFSIFFKNGSLTTTQAIVAFDLLNAKSGSGKEKFLKELAWREFYYSILYHFPNVERESFIEKFRQIKWENREDYFAAWCSGRTGFPIIDAGIRELIQTGWMHNRVRMIVASFLTKDLLIDWRWGEKFFMEKLLDGDLAPNNGGWQWAASTGCDPQPYFRIFNPWLQALKFDPEAEYIKSYIPELAKYSPKEIHDSESDLTKYGYPKPIVEHATQKMRALELFKVEG